MVFKCIGTYRHKGQVAIKLEAVDIEHDAGNGEIGGRIAVDIIHIPIGVGVCLVD